MTTDDTVGDLTRCLWRATSILHVMAAASELGKPVRARHFDDLERVIQEARAALDVQ